MSGVRPVNWYQPPSLLLVIMNADNLSVKFPNQWTAARSTCSRATAGLKVKEVVYGWMRWRVVDVTVLTATTSPITTVTCQIIGQLYDKVSHVVNYSSNIVPAALTWPTSALWSFQLELKKPLELELKQQDIWAFLFQELKCQLSRHCGILSFSCRLT